MKYIQELDMCGSRHFYDVTVEENKLIPTHLTEEGVVLLEVAYQLERIGNYLECGSR